MNGNGETRELPVLSDAEISTLYAICFAASQLNTSPFQALFTAYRKQFEVEALDEHHDSKIFRWMTEVGEQARRYYRDGQPTDFRPFLKSLFDARGIQLDGLEEFEQSILSPPLRSERSRPARRVSFDNAHLEETWLSERSEFERSSGRSGGLKPPPRGLEDTPYRPATRSVSSHGYLPSREPVTRSDRPATPLSEYGSEDERSLALLLKDPETELMAKCEGFQEVSDVRSARRCFNTWRAHARQVRIDRLRSEAQLFDIAVAHNRKQLLQTAVKAWCEEFAIRRQAAQRRREEQERATAREAILHRHLREKDYRIVRDAFTHWLETTRYQRRAVEQGRLRVLKVRYFLRWRKIAVANATRARSLLLRKYLNLWREKTARRQLEYEQADAHFEESLTKRLLRRWVWLFRERRVEVWHEQNLKRTTLASWIARLRLCNDQEDQAYDQYETRLVTSALGVLKRSIAKQQEAAVVAQSHDHQKLMAGCYQALTLQAKLSPLAATVTIKVDFDLKRKALGIWRLRLTLTRQAAEVGRRRVLQSAWTVWNDRLRTKAVGQRIDERVLLESLYRWVMHTRARIFERVRNARLLQRTFASWKEKLRTTAAALTQSSANFDASQRWRTLKYGMLRLNIAVRNHEDAARAATEFSNSRALPDVLDVWRARAQHVQKLGQWAVDARFYCLATRTLKLWRERTEQHKQTRRKEAYAHIRARIKIRLARDCLAQLHNRASSIAAQREQAAQMVQSRAFAVGIQAFEKWRDRTATLSSLAIQAQASDQQKLMSSALAALLQHHEDVEDMHVQAQRFRQETDQELLRSAIKRIQWSTFTATRRAETADALWARNRDQHIRHMLRYWAAQVAARRAPKPNTRDEDENNDPTAGLDASPSLRPASRAAARSAERPVSRQALPTRATPPSPGIALQPSTVAPAAGATPAYLRTPRSRSRRANRLRAQLLPTPAPVPPMTFNRNFLMRTPAPISAARFRQPQFSTGLEPIPNRGDEIAEETDVFDDEPSAMSITPFARKLRAGGVVSSAARAPPPSALRGAGTGLGRSIGAGMAGTGKSVRFVGGGRFGNSSGKKK